MNPFADGFTYCSVLDQCHVAQRAVVSKQCSTVKAHTDILRELQGSQRLLVQSYCSHETYACIVIGNEVEKRIGLRFEILLPCLHYLLWYD